MPEKPFKIKIGFILAFDKILIHWFVFFKESWKKQKKKQNSAQRSSLWFWKTQVWEKSGSSVMD